MFEVVKVQGGYGVRNWNGDFVIGYKNRKTADDFAAGATRMVFGEAERYNERLDIVKAYLASRVGRVYKPAAQMELF